MEELGLLIHENEHSMFILIKMLRHMNASGNPSQHRGALLYMIVDSRVYKVHLNAT